MKLTRKDWFLGGRAACIAQNSGKCRKGGVRCYNMTEYRELKEEVGTTMPINAANSGQTTL